MTTLREQREQAGWTQADVANHTGVDIRTVRRWEAAETPPRRVVISYQSILSTSERKIHLDDADEQTSASATPVSIADVIDLQPEHLPVAGPISNILGHLPSDRPFSILLGGASGGGKSSLALILANTFSEHGSVVYCTSEERIDSGTIGIRAEQLGIDSADIDVVEVSNLGDVEDQLATGYYRFCVVDSVNELDAGPADLIALMNDYRDISWVLVAQANAAEKATVGGARWRHLVDIRLWCEVDNTGDRIVRNLKNRFAPDEQQLVLKHRGARSPSPMTRTERQHKQRTPTHKEDTMPDYYDWIIKRLEGDLDTARKEIDTLRTKLDLRDDRIRELETKVNRLEIERELTQDDEQSSLSDKFDPDAIGRMADKLAPFAPVLGELIKGFMPSGTQSNVPPVPATPYHFNSPYASSPLPLDDAHTLFPDLENKR